MTPLATASPADTPPDRQADVVAFLEQGGAFGKDKVARRIHTHGAHIFLAGDKAWKLKRAVRFGYLDFSTVQKRHDALAAELRLNRRTAPGLYRALHPIRRDRDGKLAIDGEGEVADWLLEMRRFPDDALFDGRAERGLLDPPLLTRLADRIAAFHASAAVARTDRAAARFRAVIEGTLSSMRAYPGLLDPGQVHALEEAWRHALQAQAPLLDARGLAGRVRHGHGDLHLANIALIEGEPVPFDCLEFSAELATVDVLYDLAFLLMDLWRRNLRLEANIVFNRYLDLSAADESGLAPLPLFLSVRAAIRAHVLAARASLAEKPDPATREAVRAYADLAQTLLAPGRPRLIAVGGLSGTGKSSVARMLGGALGRAPGARIVRSDVLRKRLAGLSPEARLPRDSYSAEAAAAVYAQMIGTAAAALAQGQSVIADAVFADSRERAHIAEAAAKAGAAFDGLWLEAPDAMRLDRVNRRTGDASDADAGVARAQADYAIGSLGAWHRVPAAGALDEVAAEARAALRL